jgi:glycosyltransferase involved in cell wall biosynthesis
MSVVAAGLEEHVDVAYAPHDGGSSRHRVALVEIDIARGFDAIPGFDPDGLRWTAALVLVRIFTEPIGVLSMSLTAGGASAAELARAVRVEFEQPLSERVAAAGLQWSGEVPTDGLRPACTPAFVQARERALREGPSITVAICTRGRPQGLDRALTSLAGQEYPRMHVLVVDNAPPDDRSRVVAGEHASRLDLSYIVEPRPGLSRARNLAIDASDSEIVAWIDDDEEVCDPWWAAEVARGFVEHPQAGAVTGMILPAELETDAQVWFEQYGGHSKGRGFRPEVFSVDSGMRQRPLYPLPPFGTGGNMAFRRDALERIGRFDEALGAGTVTLAGEDTAAFSTLLHMGGTIIWQPAAIMRHWHRRDTESLSKLYRGYGRGLSAFYLSIIVRHPRALPQLLRLAPRAVFDFVAPRGPRLGGLPSGFPKELLKVHRRGLFGGPVMYARARLAARARAASVPRVGEGS